MFFDYYSCCPPEINPASLYTELLLFAEYGNSNLEGEEEIASASTKVRDTRVLFPEGNKFFYLNSKLDL